MSIGVLLPAVINNLAADVLSALNAICLSDKVHRIMQKMLIYEYDCAIKRHIGVSGHFYLLSSFKHLRGIKVININA